MSGRFPRYPRKPHASGRARITLDGVSVYLGPFDSAESRAEYLRLQTLWEQGVRRGPAAGRDLDMSGVLARFWAEHATDYYAGKQELVQFRHALRPLRELFADLPAADFKACHLRDAMRQMVRYGWCRGTVNRMAVRIKTAMHWCEERGLVPAGTFAALRAVKGFKIGQYGVSESDGLLPVPEADVEATVRCLGRVPRAAVELLLLTAARPSEVLGLRPCDLDRSGSIELAPGFPLALGEIWACDLEKHKTAHLGHRRVVLLGPLAQAVVGPFLERPADAFLFSPRESVEEFLQDRGRRVGHAATRRPGDRYTVASLDRAVRSAARRAGVAHWSPGRLRHNGATRLLRDFGPEVTRQVLGHRTFALLLKHYALDPLSGAAEAMGRIG